ncbi:hypothetical protein ACHQM5_014821 [Ranunculus cassubicifolius]
MALARLVLKSQEHRLTSASSFLSPHGLKRFTTTSTPSDSKFDTPDSREISTNEGKKSKSFPISLGGHNLWRNNSDILPSSLREALHQASENFNRVLHKLAPSRLLGRFREHDECYKIKYHVPGLAKDEIKITVEDGVLHIKGEHKEEDEDGTDDEEEHWSSYGYYNASLFLPDDAKADEIKAQLKDGVLRIVIPRTERPKKDVKEVEIL